MQILFLLWSRGSSGKLSVSLDRFVGYLSRSLKEPGLAVCGWQPVVVSEVRNLAKVLHLNMLVLLVELLRFHTSFSCYSFHLHPSRDELVRIVASELLCEEIGLMVKRMETYVDMVGAFIAFALHWSIVDWANCAGLDETIYLSSFRLGQFFCVGLEWLIPIYF